MTLGKKTVDGVDVPIWTDKVTCAKAILLLRGTAAKWIETLLGSQATELTVWEDFKKSFKERFAKPVSLAEKLNLMTELRMTASESVLDFYDRCTNNISLIYEEEWETLPWGTPNVLVTNDHKKVSKNYQSQCVNIHLKLAFAAGLRDSIKRQTLIQPTESLESILKVAQRVELAIIDVGDSEEEAEVGAVNLQKKPVRFQGASNQNGAGGANRRPGGPPPEC